MATVDTPITLAAGADALAPPLTFRQMAWRRFRRHRMAMAGAVILILLFVYAFGGGLIFTAERANFTDTSARLQGPSAAHPFGTDTVGRDVLARTIQGGRISLMIGLMAAVLEIVIGVVVGAVAGYYGGVVDSLLMRLTEAMLIIPSLFLLIVAGQSTPGQFICPSAGDTEDDLRNRGTDAAVGTESAGQPGKNRFDFRGYPYLSYAYQVPYGFLKAQSLCPA